MFSSASRRLLVNIQKTPRRFITSNGASKRIQSSSSSPHAQEMLIKCSIAATGLITLLTTVIPLSSDENTTFCDVRKMGGEVVMLGPTKEPSTGILFPHLCNGMQFVGCGVRVKYGFVKVWVYVFYHHVCCIHDLGDMRFNLYIYLTRCFVRIARLLAMLLEHTWILLQCQPSNPKDQKLFLRHYLIQLIHVQFESSWIAHYPLTNTQQLLLKH